MRVNLYNMEHGRKIPIIIIVMHCELDLGLLAKQNNYTCALILITIYKKILILLF